MRKYLTERSTRTGPEVLIKKREYIVRIFNVLLIIPIMVLGGCAGTASKAKFVQAPKANVKVDTNDVASIHVVAGVGVDMLQVEEQRMAQLIEQNSM